MASSQNLGRLSTLPNEILLKIIHALIDTNVSGHQTLIRLIQSSARIRNLFLEYSGSTLVRVLRRYPVSEYLFRLFFESKDDNVGNPQDLIEKVNAFVAGELKVETSELKRIAGGKGPIDVLQDIHRLSVAGMGPGWWPGWKRSCICLVGRPASFLYNWLDAGPAYCSAAVVPIQFAFSSAQVILARQFPARRLQPGQFLLVRDRDRVFGYGSCDLSRLDVSEP